MIVGEQLLVVLADTGSPGSVSSLLRWKTGSGSPSTVNNTLSMPGSLVSVNTIWATT